jgi:hypothetical protein
VIILSSVGIMIEVLRVSVLITLLRVDMRIDLFGTRSQYSVAIMTLVLRVGITAIELCVFYYSTPFVLILLNSSVLLW